jgi:hypothetical protein
LTSSADSVTIARMVEDITVNPYLWAIMMAMRSEPWLAELEAPPAKVSPARV